MMPCSSGNSPTIAVSRSHLQSSAARAHARRVGAEHGLARARDLRCQRADAPRLVAERAELGLEGDRIEAARARGKRLLRSCSQKNAASARRGRTTRSLPATHLRRIAAVDIADGDEARQQRAVRVFDGEIALVILQRRDQHLARQRQEARLEMPGERHRPLDQRGDFIEQRVAHQWPAAQASRRRPRPARGSCAPLPRTPPRPCRARAASARSWPGRRCAAASGAMKRWPKVRLPAVMPSSVAGTTSCPNSSTQPVHRAHELRLTRAPAHALGIGSASRALLHQAGQQLHGGGAGLDAA